MIQVKVSDRSVPSDVTELTTDRIDLSEYGAKDISLNLSNSEISSMVRQGDNLVIYLANGETIILADFYLENEDGKENRLLLIDQSGDSLEGLKPENYEYSDNDIFAQTLAIGELDTEAQTAAELGVAPPSLTTIGIIAGIAGLVTVVSSAGDDDPAPAAAETEEVTEAAPIAATAPTVNASNSTSLTGSGTAGATIAIDTNGDGQADYTAVVDENGNWEVELDEPIAQGVEVSVTQTDATGNTLSIAAPVTIDNTPPVQPTVLQTSGETISGFGEPSSTIEIDIDGDGEPDLTTTVNSNGFFSVVADEPIEEGTMISVTQIDPSGNSSDTSIVETVAETTPVDPVVVPSDGNTISGTGEPGATIEIDTNGDGIPDETTMVDADGNFSVELDEPLPENAMVSVTQTDTSGVTTNVEEVVAVDTTEPNPPTVNPTDGMTISGTGEPGATIEIDTNGDGMPDATAIVDEDGEFSVTLGEPLDDNTEISVTQTDTGGNTSQGSTNESADVSLDTTPPAEPTVNPTNGQTISGTGEPGATIDIDTDGDGVANITDVPVDGDGNWEVTADPVIPAESTLSVTQTDTAGNVSQSAATVSVVEDPTVNPTNGITISGTGEPGATIGIDTNCDHIPDFTVTVNEDGTWFFTFPDALVDGTEVMIFQTALNGNPHCEC